MLDHGASLNFISSELAKDLGVKTEMPSQPQEVMFAPSRKKNVSGAASLCFKFKECQIWNLMNNFYDRRTLNSILSGCIFLCIKEDRIG